MGFNVDHSKLIRLSFCHVLSWFANITNSKPNRFKSITSLGPWLLYSVLEGDSQVVINDLRLEGKSLASFGHLLELVKPTINAFNCISFSYIRKLDNFVTNNLAKYVHAC